MAIGDAPKPNTTGPDKVKEGNEKLSLRVLVADDDRLIREMLTEILEDGGHKVEAVENGQLLMNKLATGEYDLVVTDLKMPLKTGTQAIEEIYSGENKKLNKLPVILITGEILSKIQEKRLEELGVPYLSKPFDIDKLLQTVKEKTQKPEPVK